jgi:hypothetical protein
MRRLSEYSGPVHLAAEALDRLREDGHTPPALLPAVLPGSLRPHHDPAKAWVYDERNRTWLDVDSPLPRRRFLEWLRGGVAPQPTAREAERRVERTLRARFN